MPISRTIARGVTLAVLAALAFGITTPFVAWASRGVGALASACLLYAGAGAAALVMRAASGRGHAPLRSADAPRLVAIALVGGAIGPTLLVWGLQHAGATLGALLLNLEAGFTVALAWIAYREPIGRRVLTAVILMTAGGAALTLDAWTGSSWSVLGVAAVAGATLAWASDNTLTRPLAERDPLVVVVA
jgi:drug/metabolite transporter (DMT)-like permease